MGMSRFCLLGAAVTLLLVVNASFSRAEEPQGFDGLIEPRMVVKVGSAVRGVLDKVVVDRGDMVKKGQVLATLQSDVERATMELARVRSENKAAIEGKQEELEFAKRNQERRKDLYDQKALPYNEWDEVVTKKILAEHGLAEARERQSLGKLELKQATAVVNRLTIRSPLTGVVVDRYLSPGEYVEDQPILQLAQIDPLYVEVILPVDKLGSVKEGMLANVRPEMPVGGNYNAKVIIVDKVVDAASGTFGVRLELPNPEYKLPAGLKCKVIFPSL